MSFHAQPPERARLQFINPDAHCPKAFLFSSRALIGFRYCAKFSARRKQREREKKIVILDYKQDEVLTLFFPPDFFVCYTETTNRWRSFAQFCLVVCRKWAQPKREAATVACITNHSAQSQLFTPQLLFAQGEVGVCWGWPADKHYQVLNCAGVFFVRMNEHQRNPCTCFRLRGHFPLCSSCFWGLRKIQ